MCTECVPPFWQCLMDSNAICNDVHLLTLFHLGYGDHQSIWGAEKQKRNSGVECAACRYAGMLGELSHFMRTFIPHPVDKSET